MPRRTLLILCLLLVPAACAHEPPERRCRYGAVWVEGHYGPRGRWHPAHWRCRGVTVIEVE